MNNIVKRIISTIIMLVLVLSLASCGGKSFKCDMCDEEKSGKSYKSELMGEEITICEDCYDEMNELIGN